MNIYRFTRKGQGKLFRVILSFFLGFIVTSCFNGGDKANPIWEVTGGSKNNIRYSSLQQIDTSNVKNLQVAWVYQSEKGDSTNFGPMECNPIIIRDTLYGVSPKLKLLKKL